MNKGYILNLTSIFHAGNFIYYFLPGMAAGRILLFHRLAQTPLPGNGPDEAYLQQLFTEWNNHFQALRLNPYEKADKMTVSVLLDLKPWSYGGFGELSRFPFVKIHLLKEVFDKFFTSAESDDIVFRYFILKRRGEPADEYAAFIDQCKGILPYQHPTGIPLNTGKYIPPWCIFGELPFQKGAMAVIEALHRCAQERIPHEARNFFKEKIQDLAKNLLQIPPGTQEELPSRVREFFRQFSSSHYLREERKDMVLYYGVDTDNAPDAIAGWEGLAALLTESYASFGNYLQQLYDTSPLWEVERVVLNPHEASTYLQRFRSLARQARNELESLRTEAVPVRLTNLVEPVNPATQIHVDEEKLNAFEEWIKEKEIPLFSSTEFMEHCRKKFQHPPFHLLDEAVKGDPDLLLRAYDGQGDYGQASETVELTPAQMEEMLQKLKAEERRAKVNPGASLQAYKRQLKEYKKKLPGLASTCLERTRKLLPGDMLWSIPLIFTVPFFVTVWPLFFPHSFKGAVTASFIFFTFMLIMSFLMIRIPHKELLGAYNELKKANAMVVKALREYIDKLKRTAATIRQNSIRKINIRTLEEKLKERQTLIEQAVVYYEFYARLSEEMEKNGHTYEGKPEMVAPIPYGYPPYRDSRLLLPRPVAKMKIALNDNEALELIRLVENPEVLTGIIDTVHLNPIPNSCQ